MIHTCIHTYVSYIYIYISNIYIYIYQTYIYIFIYIQYLSYIMHKKKISRVADVFLNFGQFGIHSKLFEELLRVG